LATPALISEGQRFCLRELGQVDEFVELSSEAEVLDYVCCDAALVAVGFVMEI